MIRAFQIHPIASIKSGTVDISPYHPHTTFSEKNEVEHYKATNAVRKHDDCVVLRCYFARDVSADVSAIVEASKQDAVRAINIALLRRNHLIGKRIDEEILSTRANDYGKSIIKKLSAFLTERFGSGFDESNLYSFVRLYRYFPNIFDSLSPKSFLSWTHYRVLIRVDSDVARPYYEKEALASAGASATCSGRSIANTTKDCSPPKTAACLRCLRESLPPRIRLST